jgi:biopolymer transport protein ExbB
MLDLLLKGGPVMIPIALSALIATTIIIERLLFYRSRAASDRAVSAKLERTIAAGRFDEAAEVCAASDASMARLGEAALKFRDYPEQDVKEAVINAAGREVPRLERSVGALGTIANIATLLGLFGTVTGNIKAFGVLAATGAMGNPSLLAGSIAEALVTTASGLAVSIPAIIFYNYFVSLTNRLIAQMESRAGDLVLMICKRSGQVTDGGPRAL